SLAVHVAHSRVEPAGGGGQNIGEDGTKPGQLFGLGRAAELPPGFVGPQYHLLNDVRGVQFHAEARSQLRAREKPEVIPIPQQRSAVGFVDAIHGTCPTIPLTSWMRSTCARSALAR